MFNGFSEQTVQYFEKLRFNNNKLFFKNSKSEYDQYIKEPLYALYNDLTNTLYTIDNELECRPQKCISSPYTDARFNRNAPIKEYIYLRYKLSRERKTDIPGFFFDASIDLVRFGITVYNITPSGMGKIRSGFIVNSNHSNMVIKRAIKDTGVEIEGKTLIKDRFPDVRQPLKDFLNHKEIRICYILKEYNYFFESLLCDKMKETYQSISALYHIIKLHLDKTI